MEKKKIVREGYNKVALAYQNERHENLEEMKILPEFTSRVTKGGKILDVGCGGGLPFTKYLSEQFDVIGIDISDKQIEIAKKNVPKAQFIRKDMTELDFPTAYFDGILAYYSIIHVPREEHFDLFKNFYRMLKPNGILVINSGTRQSEGMSDFFGEPMFWSNNSPEKTLDLVKRAGFVIEFEGILRRGREYQYWIFARKPNE